MKAFKCLLLTLLCLTFVTPALADGRDGSSNYLYSFYGQTVAAPPAYTLSKSVIARNLPGVDALKDLTDAYVTKDAVYVLCAGALLVLGHDFALNRVINSYIDQNGADTPLAGCTGITVTETGEYYIAQSENARILHFSPDGTLIRELGRPDITGFENVKYRPTKLVLDSAGRIYVVSKGMYEGIVQLNPDGTFSRFFGVNKVNFTLWQLIWRVFATQEQRDRQVMWLPSDFTNLCVDQDGFLFATLLAQEKFTVKRLNAKGENIIKVPDNEPYPDGDRWTTQTGFGIPTGYSQFIAVDANDCGVYICLDGTRSRVFAYNEDHKLLFAFGGIGDREGYFRSPVDVCFVGDNILVLDSLAQSLEVFSPTRYGEALMSAVRCQYQYDYEKAAGYWEEALSYNHNLTLAYSGIGRMLLRSGEYDKAMEYLRLGEDRKYYDKAYEKVRNREMRKYFVPGVIALAAIIAGGAALSMTRRHGRRKKECAA